MARLLSVPVIETVEAMTVFSGRLLIADTGAGGGVYEVDPDGRHQRLWLRTTPPGVSLPRGMTVLNDRLLLMDAGTRALHGVRPGRI